MRELVVVFFWLRFFVKDKGSAGNDSPYMMAALVKTSLQS
jgi:hypothetical protein